MVPLNAAQSSPRVLLTLAEGRSETALSALTQLQERAGAVCAELDPAGPVR